MNAPPPRAVRLRDGHTMHVRSFGRGPTVVLLHGFAMHGAMWAPLVLPLARAHRFVLPDLRGFGRSHHVPFTKRDALAQLTDDVEDLLAQLGDAPVRLGGLSMGALTGLSLAARGGFRRVSGYVHVDQSPRIHNGDGYAHGLFGARQPERFAAMRALLDEATPLRDRAFDALPPALSARIRAVFGEFLQTAVRPGWMKAVMGAVRHPRVAPRVFPLAHWQAYLDVLRSYLDERYDFRGALAGVRAPVTVMVGDDSEMYPAAGQLELARSVAHAEVVRFGGSGHAVPYESPVAFVRALRRALAG